MAVANTQSARKQRDIRLDFFRGVCFFIIFIAHVFGNPWGLFIPARFGLSDAAEIFVFLSGMASAAAFATVFVRHGAFMGIARVAHRVWQVYWAHISIFFVCTAIMVLLDRHLETGENYVRILMMEPFFNENARQAFVGLMTLTYVPPFFDILPMYLVILCMIPVVMILSQFSKWYAMVAVVLTWLVASFNVLDLPRAPWSDEIWYFNPFSWQLVFFTGFAFMRGWLPAPKADARLITAAVLYLLICLPLEWQPLLNAFPVLRETRDWLYPVFIDKTHQGIMRFVHFLALAYLSYLAVGEGGRYLRGPIVAVISKVGQASLGVFILTLALSFTASAALDVLGRTYFSVPLVNLSGMAIMVGAAYVITWFKASPWKRPAADGAPRHGEQSSSDLASWRSDNKGVQPAE